VTASLSFPQKKKLGSEHAKKGRASMWSVTLLTFTYLERKKRDRHLRDPQTIQKEGNKVQISLRPFLRENRWRPPRCGQRRKRVERSGCFLMPAT